MEGRGLGVSSQGHVPAGWEWGGIRSSSSRGGLRKASKSKLLRAHTLRGSIPGAEDGREPPRPGGPWSKPFTALGTRESPSGEEQPGAGHCCPLPSTQNPDPAPPSSHVPGSRARTAPGRAPALAARAVPTPGPELARPGRGDCPRRTSGPRAMMVT